MSKFQIVVAGIIAVLVFVAFLVLSGVVPGLPGLRLGADVRLTLWGVFPQEYLVKTLEQINSTDNSGFSITYVEKDPVTYQQELVEALASGQGPDMWFLTQDWILKNKDRVYQIPFSVFSQRSFKDTFINPTEIFMSPDGQGFYAVPVVVDPLVLYYNKNIFSAAGLASSPKTWNEFLNNSQIMTVKDGAGNILQSGAALGEFTNIKSAKDIFSLLVLQSGNKIVEPAFSNETVKYILTFGDRGDLTVEPAVSALTFFTAFSNPSKVSYSWNRALLNSADMFNASRLAMYFGYAGEFRGISQKNPYLSFDAAGVPQSDSSSYRTTFGRIYGLAVSKASVNVSVAVNAAFVFAGQNILSQFSMDSFLPPARRDMLSAGSGDPVMAVFYKAAIQSTAWLEPDPEAVTSIFKDMVESAVTGKKLVSKAVNDVRILLSKELEKIK